MPVSVPITTEGQFLNNLDFAEFGFAPSVDGVYNITLFALNDSYTAAGELTPSARVNGDIVNDKDGDPVDTSTSYSLERGEFCTIAIPLVAGGTVYIQTGAAKIAGIVRLEKPFISREAKGSELSFEEMDANVALGKEAIFRLEQDELEALAEKHSVEPAAKTLIPNGDIDAFFDAMSSNYVSRPIQLGTDDNGQFGFGYMQIDEYAGNFVVRMPIPGFDSVFSPSSMLSFGKDYYDNLSITEWTIEADEYGSSGWVTSTVTNADLVAMKEIAELDIGQGEEHIVLMAFAGDNYLAPQIGKGFGNFGYDFSDSPMPYSEPMHPAEVCGVPNRVLTTVSMTVGQKNIRVARWCAMNIDEYNNITFDPSAQAG